MDTHLVPIGNSRGIRIPAEILRQCGFKGPVRLKVQDNRLIISPITTKKRKPREGWAEAIDAAGPAPLEWDDTIDLDDAGWTW